MTPYYVFVDAFLNKISEYHFVDYPDDVMYKLAVGYMKTACSKFARICEADLKSFDDEQQAFLTDDIDDEIVDIVSEGMVAEWVKPYVNNSDNLENVLNTKDFTLYSSANLLSQVRSLEESSRKNFVQMMREYSYNHGDLTVLHI